MFMGEFHHNIDEKGRLIIPSKFREELGKKFVVTRGIEEWLFVYSLDEWNNMVNDLKSLPFTRKDARTFTRMFLSGATECELDNNGRINLPSPLINYATLEKECVVIGVNDRLEIWSNEKYEDFFNTNIDRFDEIAENLFNE